MSLEKKFVLIDAYALIYRSYYALLRNPMYNSEGLNTSAIYGFVNALEEVLSRLRPTCIGVAFDGSGPTFRHELFPEYKANRQATPEDIRLSVPVIKEILEAYRIPVLQCALFEADDIIGTYACRAAGEGYDVYMVTPDKDYMQLVTDKIKMYKPAKNQNGPEIIGGKEVCEAMGLTSPGQFIDILAIMGDASDNIPGAFGIGEKGALHIIQTYGSVDGIYERIDEIPNKWKEKLIQSRDKVILSKTLATICTEVPLPFNEQELIFKDPDYDKLLPILTRLQFNTLKNRLEKRRNGIGQISQTDAITTEHNIKVTPKHNVKVTSVKNNGQYSLFQETADTEEITQDTAPSDTIFQTLSDLPHSYIRVDTDEETDSLVNNLSKCKEFVFDTEATSKDALNAELVGMSFSWEEGTAYYVPVPADKKRALEITGKFRDLFRNPDIIKIGQNIKYDISVLSRYAINVEAPLFDTMLAHYLLQPEHRHNMQFLAESYLQYSPIPIEELIGPKGKGQCTMREVDIDKVVEYAGEDADVTLKLYRVLYKKLKEESLLDIATNIEMALTRVLSDMESEGIRLDTADMDEFAESLKVQIIEIEEKIYSIAGTRFNISSPQQLGIVLFETLKISDSPKKTKTKQYSTSEETIQALSHKHPVIELILEYRGLRKLLSTYVEALPKLINPGTGRIHTNFNQAVTSTGRLSSTDPNLQNIPVREDRGREIRKAFVARDENHVLLSADYSQIELRLMADMSGDKQMIEAFFNNEDIHASTAAKIFNVPIDEVTGDMRRKAKTANFGIIYGISGFGLSQRLNIPRNEAQSLINGYFRIYPQVQMYMVESIENARKKGYVETIFGRRRFLSDINSRNANIRGMAERNAINAPIQGSAADLIKIAMIRIWDVLRKERLKTKMILQVHDELLFDVPKEEVEQVKRIVKIEMENVYKLKVPLLVEIGAGKNWLEAH